MILRKKKRSSPESNGSTESPKSSMTTLTRAHARSVFDYLTILYALSWITITTLGMFGVFSVSTVITAYLVATVTALFSVGALSILMRPDGDG